MSTYTVSQLAHDAGVSVHDAIHGNITRRRLFKGPHFRSFTGETSRQRLAKIWNPVKKSRITGAYALR